MQGLYFEELKVGMVFDHAQHRTVTEADNVFFSALTHNPALLHLDEEYWQSVADRETALARLEQLTGLSLHEEGANK